MTDTAVANHPCDGCSQMDNHPMVHVYATWQKNDRTTVSDPSFHFDCLPAEYEGLLGDDAPQHENTRATIAKARSGVHGDKLRTFIESLPDDNNTEPSDDGES